MARVIGCQAKYRNTWMSLAWLELLPVDSVDVVDKLRWLGVFPNEGLERTWYSSSFSDLTPGSESFVSVESIRRIVFLFSPGVGGGGGQGVG